MRSSFVLYCREAYKTISRICQNGRCLQMGSDVDAGTARGKGRT